jgi:hypothetical protein
MYKKEGGRMELPFTPNASSFHFAHPEGGWIDGSNF